MANSLKVEEDSTSARQTHGVTLGRYSRYCQFKIDFNMVNIVIITSKLIDLMTPNIRGLAKLIVILLPATVLSYK